MNYSATDLDDLIVLCKKKNTQAQMEVYNRFHKNMYHTSLNILGNNTDAEDIMHDSFIVAFSKLNQYKGKNQFAGWLKQIVINKSLNLYKKNKRYTLDENIHLKLKENDNSHNDNKEEKINTVFAGLSKIKEKYQTAISLYYLEGYSYEEIGEILNISQSNCRILIHRGKLMLKKYIDERKTNN